MKNNKLYAASMLADENHDDGEKFIQNIAMLIQEAMQNNGKVSSKNLLSVFGKDTIYSEQRRVKNGRSEMD